MTAPTSEEQPPDETPPDTNPPDTNQGVVIDFLSRPETYGGGVDRVERIDTHISIVFLVGDYAYKLKKAVRFPYLDFSSLSARRGYCRAELEINRRARASAPIRLPMLVWLSPMRSRAAACSMTRGPISILPCLFSRTCRRA